MVWHRFSEQCSPGYELIFPLYKMNVTVIVVKKWTRLAGFKSWTRLSTFYFLLMPLRRSFFSFKQYVNSWRTGFFSIVKTTSLEKEKSLETIQKNLWRICAPFYCSQFGLSGKSFHRCKWITCVVFLTVHIFNRTLLDPHRPISTDSIIYVYIFLARSKYIVRQILFFIFLLFLSLYAGQGSGRL